jgi:hypothetical protein
MSEQEDTRPRVAVYGIVRKHKDGQAHDLAVAFCYENGWLPIEYVDRAFPREGQPSEWARIMSDIEKGLLYGVIVRWEVKGLFDYCEAHNTKLCILDRPLDLMPSLFSGRRVRIC